METVPKASIVLPHEILNIMFWLDEATCDERLVQFWRLAIILASQERLRIGELFGLRLIDIQFFREVAVLQIVHGKTAAAKKIYRLAIKIWLWRLS